MIRKNISKILLPLLNKLIASEYNNLFVCKDLQLITIVLN